MNRFGEIADQLTELLEELDRPDLAPDAQALKRALKKAVARACEADRALDESTGHKPRARPKRANSQPWSAVVVPFPAHMARRRAQT
jgi:hypothetical protein